MLFKLLGAAAAPDKAQRDINEDLGGEVDKVRGVAPALQQRGTASQRVSESAGCRGSMAFMQPMLA